MRLFVALPVPTEVAEAMAALQRSVSERYAHDEIRWQPTERAHLTLLFLGDVDEARLSDCRRALAAASRNPIPALSTARPGAFPSPARPSVLWLGVADAPALSTIQSAVARQFGALRLGDARGSYRPHLTLGRLRRPARDPEALRAALAEAATEPLTWSPDRIELVRSRLARGGAVHEVLERAPLGPAHP